MEIDKPSARERHYTHVLHVVGWVVGRESPAVEVEVRSHERLLRTIPVRGPRADVSAALDVPADTNCVFHALTGLTGLKRDARLELCVLLADGSRVHAGSV